MSLNYSEEKGAGAGAGHLQAPRLTAGGAAHYAAWRPIIDVYLQRSGAEGVHTEALTEERWLQRSSSTTAWAREALDAAEALLLGGGAIGLDGVKAEPLTEEIKAARRLLSAQVEKSRKAYGVLFSSLPDDLRAQVAHIPAGFAYGL